MGSAAAATLTPIEGVSFTGSVVPAPTSCRPTIVVINWGDGSSATTGRVAPDGSLEGTHTYNEAGTYNGSVAYTGTFNEQPCANSIPFQARVADARLTATGLAVSAGTASPFTGPLATFTDANSGAPIEDFTARIDWGDGSRSAGTVSRSGSGFVVNGTHTYSRPGKLDIGVTITDRDGASVATLAPASVASGGAASSLPAAAPPSYGRTARLRRVSGRVLVRLPGTDRFVPLDEAASIPFGSVIDTRHGVVQLVSAASTDSRQTQSANFYEGTFEVGQPRDYYINPVGLLRAAARHSAPRLGPYTQLRLVGGDFGHCAAPARRAKAQRATATIARSKRSPRSVRHLWGSGHGHFITIGRTASAAVRGTIWLTDDRCGGTLTRVARGIVQVSDFPRHRTLAVRAGHQYLANG